MFENRQDTTFFRESLVSAVNHWHNLKESKKNNVQEEEEKAFKILESTMKSLSANNISKSKSLEQYFEKQLDCNRRCHSISFMALLRSLGITCSEADAYYQSVLHNLPEIDIYFYMKSNFLLDWSEFFIECAQQLEINVLFPVLKKLLQVEYEKPLKYYVWHLSLQCIMWKLFSMECPYLFEKLEKIPSFQFRFHIHDAFLEEMDEKKKSLVKKSPLGSLSLIYNNLLELLTQEAEQEISDINYIKIVFLAFKTLFRLTTKVKEGEGPNIDIIKDLSPIFVKCLTQKSSITAIHRSLNECNLHPGALSELLISWKVNALYLLFVLENSWKDYNDFFLGHSFGLLHQHFKKFNNLMEKENLSWIFFKNIIECDSPASIQEKYYLMLKCVVTNHYPYSSRAIEYLLSHVNLWSSYKVVELLEKHLLYLDPFIIYKSLAAAIVNCQTDQRSTLLKCFHRSLAQAGFEIYNVVLKYIIDNWGYCEYFKLPDFDSELTQFSRKTMNLKEAEQVLPALFIQSPMETLHALVEQAFMQAPEGIKVLEVLSIIPAACLHEFGESLESPLVALLSDYFEFDLSKSDVKTFALIIKYLAEIEITNGKIFPFDLFCGRCILRYLHPHPCESHQIDMALDCLHAYLEVLMPDYGNKISPAYFEELIKHLGILLKYSIENGFTKLKETIVSVLDLLAKFKNKFRLHAALKNSPFNENEIITLYVLLPFVKQIPDPTYLKLKDKMIDEKCELLWVWCCNSDDEESFAERITKFGLSYENLLTILISLMPHFTKNEWARSAKLISQYLKLLNIKESDYPWLLPDGNLELYGILRCLMDCFTIIVKGKSSEDYIQLSNNLVTTIMKILNETTTTAPLLLNVFLDVCQLVSLLDVEVMYIFATLLMSLRKKFLSCCDAEIKDECIKFLQYGVNTLPDSEEKASLMEKMSIEA